MAKQNNKEKLTYKQMLSYMDFLNAKMTNKFQELDHLISTLGYYLKSYVEYNRQDKKFTKYLDKKQKEAEKESKDLGLVPPAKTEKIEKS
jgi:flagellar biosynthesis chaperone FliJ